MKKNQNKIEKIIVWSRHSRHIMKGEVFEVLESEIERRAGARVKAAGGLWLKWVSPGMAGVPDRILIAPGGRVVFVELKQECGRLSNLQRWVRDRLRGLGCDVRVTHSLEEVLDVVDEVCAASLSGDVH